MYKYQKKDIYSDYTWDSPPPYDMQSLVGKWLQSHISSESKFSLFYFKDQNHILLCEKQDRTDSSGRWLHMALLQEVTRVPAIASIFESVSSIKKEEMTIETFFGQTEMQHLDENQYQKMSPTDSALEFLLQEKTPSYCLSIQDLYSLMCCKSDIRVFAFFQKIPSFIPKSQYLTVLYSSERQSQTNTKVQQLLAQDFNVDLLNWEMITSIYSFSKRNDRLLLLMLYSDIGSLNDQSFTNRINDEHIKWLLKYRPKVLLYSGDLELIEKIITNSWVSDEEILYSFLEKIKDYNVALVQKHLATFEEGWKKAVTFFSGNPEAIKSTLSTEMQDILVQLQNNQWPNHIPEERVVDLIQGFAQDKQYIGHLELWGQFLYRNPNSSLKYLYYNRVHEELQVPNEVLEFSFQSSYILSTKPPEHLLPFLSKLDEIGTYILVKYEQLQYPVEWLDWWIRQCKAMNIEINRDFEDNSVLCFLWKQNQAKTPEEKFDIVWNYMLSYQVVLSTEIEHQKVHVEVAKYLPAKDICTNINDLINLCITKKDDFVIEHISLQSIRDYIHEVWGIQNVTEKEITKIPFLKALYEYVTETQSTILLPLFHQQKTVLQAFVDGEVTPRFFFSQQKNLTPGMLIQLQENFFTSTFWSTWSISDLQVFKEQLQEIDGSGTIQAVLQDTAIIEKKLLWITYHLLSPKRIAEHIVYYISQGENALQDDLVETLLCHVSPEIRIYLKSYLIDGKPYSSTVLDNRHFEEWSYYIPILPISEVLRDMLQFRKNTKDTMQVDTVFDNLEKNIYLMYYIKKIPSQLIPDEWKSSLEEKVKIPSQKGVC